MTTIINAVSGTGLTQTADASGVLKVQSNGVTTNALAWVNFNGVTTTTVRASFNVSSVTRASVGTYTINFTNALSDVNYVVSGCCGGVTGSGYMRLRDTVSMTTTALGIDTLNNPGTAITDMAYITAVVFGN